ncbi:diflavin flavoprotein [Chamaesiphon sp.]|uniref:diflavin flavoprotein n=1 Tax=Chamaesiphon sp. TaxID=2814140 RepID=UPI003593819A
MPPRDLQPYPIAPDTTVLRSRTWDRLKFEIEYGLARGTTANSFIITGDTKALIDPPGSSFTDAFITGLNNRFDVKLIEYVILGHINPNRGETLKKLLELAPQITFVCSNPAAIALLTILGRDDLDIIAIKGGESIDLGKGHVLRFILAPTPRWPDRLLTYDSKTQVLYSDKLFGCHVCGDQVFDEGWESYSEDRRYYFDCLMAPAAKQIGSTLDKIAEYPISLYATGHGPLVKYGLMELTNLYQQWSKTQSSQSLSVALIYASAYGNTATVAQAIASGITKAGVGVESINCEFVEPAEIKAALERCTGFIIGSPTLGGHAPTPIQTALGVILSSAQKTKLAGVFGSFGWSGEAIDLLETKLKDAGYKLGFEPIRVKFKPTEMTLKECEETGTDFAQAVKKAKKASIPKAKIGDATTDRVEQAVGRIVGSMTIVTTQQGDLSGAMLASWVSQATFNPPGLTVAVAKERAIESLMHKDGKFVLNILEQGKHIPLMKQFLKPFAPGEDRFVGVNMEAATNGCPILTDSLAYLECNVQSRMECGDHWLIYATIDTGKVFNSSGVTAVHHRKSGTHY